MSVTTVLRENITPLPYDDRGEAIPVFDPSTIDTVLLTCEVANTVYAPTTPLVPLGGRRYRYVNNAEEDSMLAIEYIGDNPNIARKIKVEVEAVSTGNIYFESNTLYIDSSKYGTAAGFVTVINADPALNKLFFAFLVDGDGSVAISDNSMFMTGYYKNTQPVIFRVFANNDAFIGTFPEGSNSTKTASMPITGGVEYFMPVRPGESIVARSATAGALVYLTPHVRY